MSSHTRPLHTCTLNRIVEQLHKRANVLELQRAREGPEAALLATNEYKALTAIAVDYCDAAVASVKALEEFRYTGIEPSELRGVADRVTNILGKRFKLDSAVRLTAEFKALHAVAGGIYVDKVLDRGFAVRAEASVLAHSGVE